MEISRSEGYRRSVGKEEPGLIAVEHFFATTMGIPLGRIVGADENYTRGDLEARSGASIECKRQPIDPARYAKNFVEVFEETRRQRHVDGLRTLGEVLDIPLGRLAEAQWKRPRDPSRETLGIGRKLSISISTLMQAALTVYVNPGGATAHIYVYESMALLDAVRYEVLANGMVRGAGNSNDDTFAVFVAIAPRRWSRDMSASDTEWRYTGSGAEGAAIRDIQELLA